MDIIKKSITNIFAFLNSCNNVKASSSNDISSSDSINLDETSVKESTEVKNEYFLTIYYQHEKNTYIYSDDIVYVFYADVETFGNFNNHVCAIYNFNPTK